MPDFFVICNISKLHSVIGPTKRNTFAVAKKLTRHFFLKDCQQIFCMIMC